MCEHISACLKLNRPRLTIVCSYSKCLVQYICSFHQLFLIIMILIALVKTRLNKIQSEVLSKRSPTTRKMSMFRLLSNSLIIRVICSSIKDGLDLRIFLIFTILIAQVKTRLNAIQSKKCQANLHQRSETLAKS